MNVTEIMPGNNVDTSLAPLSDTIAVSGAELPLSNSEISSLTTSLAQINSPETESSDARNEYFVLFLILMIFFIIPGGMTLRNHMLLRKKIRRTLMAKSETYHDHLMENIHFYRLLPPDQKKRFLERVTAFMYAREFKYVNVEKEERMPLLISAAAVQLTFGLDEFLLDHFKIIYILKDDYRYGDYNMPFMGHVDHSGIYLSWNNFLRGFQNYSDAHNVGIHEMAHALAYVNFMSDKDGQDDHFKNEFRHFSRTARPIFESMKKGQSTLLDAYAATNFHEFWAVSVETFFERSAAMKDQMPALYAAMCELLRQDPLQWSV